MYAASPIQAMGLTASVLIQTESRKPGSNLSVMPNAVELMVHRTGESAPISTCIKVPQLLVQQTCTSFLYVYHRHKYGN